METDKNEMSGIITGSDLNHRTFNVDESWNSLQSTILAGNWSTTGDTNITSGDITNARKENLTTVDEEEACNDKDITDDVLEDSNFLNMNIDAISDDVFVDCPYMCSPRPYTKELKSPCKIKFNVRKLNIPQINPYLTLESAASSTNTSNSQTQDSGIQIERTGSMLGQIIDDFNDMKDHAQSTPKVTINHEEYNFSTKNSNNIDRASDLIQAKSKMSMIDHFANERNAINNSKKKLVCVDDKVKSFAMSCTPYPKVSDSTNDNVNDNLPGVIRNNEPCNQCSFKDESPYQSRISTQQSDNHDLNVINDKNRRSEFFTSDAKTDANNVTDVTKKNDRGASHKYFLPIDKTNKENYYEGRYSKAVIKSKIPIRKSPYATYNTKHKVAEIKQFFENRTRMNDNANEIVLTRCKKPPIGKKVELCKTALCKSTSKTSPKFPSYHTRETFKLRRSSKSDNLNVASYTSSGTSSFLTRNAPVHSNRCLRSSSCSDYPSPSTKSRSPDSLLSLNKHKSTGDLVIATTESSLTIKSEALKISVHANKITKHAYLSTNQLSALRKKSPRETSSYIVKRKSIGFVSSPIKSVRELRKMFSPSPGKHVNAAKKPTSKPPKTIPTLIVNGLHI